MNPDYFVCESLCVTNQCCIRSGRDGEQSSNAVHFNSSFSSSHSLSSLLSLSPLSSLPPLSSLLPFSSPLPSPLIPLPVSDDVAVIDEMQMLKDEDRGGAWTRAILGQPPNSSSTYTPSNGSHCVLCDPFPPHTPSHITHQAFLLGKFICVDRSVQSVS